MDLWAEIHRQRLSVADLLDDLSAAQWDHPSLCAGWTVRDVAAHLTLQQMGPRDMLAMVIRWRGGLEATVQDTARRRAAARTADQIVATIRDTAARRRHNFGVTPLETLADLLVHGQDIAMPLGQEYPMPPQAAAAVATRMLTMRFPPPLPAARSMTGVRLVATDTSWSHGVGPEVCGPIAALLLVITGRVVALPQLTGPGAAALTGRLQNPRT